MHASTPSAHWLFLVPLFPALGAAVNGLLGAPLQRRFGKGVVHTVAVGAMAASMLLVWGYFLGVLLPLPAAERYLVDHVFDMAVFPAWDLRLQMSFAFDPLSATMALIITTIGTAIHVYSIGYMHDEPSYWRFFSYLNLFCFAMLLLVLGDNFLLMFFGWEGVGLCSYLLIGFWYKDLLKAKAGMKAFVANRFGDFGFVIGLFLLFTALGAGNAALDNRAHWSNPPGDYHAPAFLGSEVDATIPVAAPDEADEALSHGAVTAGTSANPTGEMPAAAAAALEHGPLGTVTEKVKLGPTINFRELRLVLAAPVKDDAAGGAVRPLGEVLRDRKVLGIGLVTLVCLLFFVGATGKSAQIPLYVWLPDAMEGPTPVSALIHAATMVTAGVYMVARLNFLFALSPAAMTVVAGVGVLTALFAASIGFFQYDIKKVLAYSTISQLGFMFIGVGVGGYWAGVYHLLTHACFKACLFLGAGSVIHAMHPIVHDDDEAQDMRNMGGLRKWLPRTRWTYLIACVAIAGFPVANGFYSKDEILWKAFSAQHLLIPGWTIWLVGWITAGGTAFYMFRSYFMTFEGSFRGFAAAHRIHAAHAKDDHAALGHEAKDAHGHGPADLAHAHGDDHGHEAAAPEPHESPATMTGVLVFLAGLCFATILLGLWAPVGIMPLLERWLEPVLASSAAHLHFAHSKAAEWGLMVASVGIAAVGTAAAYLLYGKPSELPARLKERYHALWQLAYDKYRVDELYEATVLRGAVLLSKGIGLFDKNVVDGVVNGVGAIVRFVAFADGLIDKYVVDGAVNGVANAFLAGGRQVRKLQTGRIQHYAAVAAIGVLILFVIFRFVA
jgi:NADH-quinone oxidoreductase subunit L